MTSFTHISRSIVGLSTNSEDTSPEKTVSTGKRPDLDNKFIGDGTPSGGNHGTCFLAWQKVLMADGTHKPIGDISVGEVVAGRWRPNKVRGIEKPLLGNRSMWQINGNCWNTPDHPMWTQTGWQVIDKDAYVANDWQCKFDLHDDVTSDDVTGKVWRETYTPCHPDRMGVLVPGKSSLAVPGRLKFVPLTSLVESTGFPPDTQLYALALDACRTMYVDGFCFSGWADETKVDYQSRIGT